VFATKLQQKNRSKKKKIQTLKLSQRDSLFWQPKIRLKLCLHFQSVITKTSALATSNCTFLGCLGSSQI
jgi:hypothetical protein